MIMHFMRCKTICFLAITALLPQFALAATPQVNNAEKAAITDIALHDGGILVGRVLDRNGESLVRQKISVRQNADLIAETVTDKNGQFIIDGLRGGIYQIASERGVGSFRAWAHQTAPPTAHQLALLVEDDQVVRGQFGWLPFPSTKVSAAEWIAITLGAAGLIVGTIALTQEDSDAS